MQIIKHSVIPMNVSAVLLVISVRNGDMMRATLKNTVLRVVWLSYVETDCTILCTRGCMMTFC